MKVAFVWLACTAACGFQSPAVGGDGNPGSDAAIADSASIDAAPMIDASIDAATVGRTRVDLIGLWTFDEIGGNTMADTSDVTPKVPLSVKMGNVTLAGGQMTPNGIAVVASGNSPHINADVMNAEAVTLEAWVTPLLGSQGSMAAPVVVAGLCSSVVSRNISILQIGSRWVARVRTTTDLNGGPDLMSSTDIVAGQLVHLVVADNATERVLYVNGVLDATDGMPGPPRDWDDSYKVSLGNELSGNRQWAGSFSLVAMYKRALSLAEIAASFAAGPNAQ